MHVAHIGRYPVKSMLGESPDAVSVTAAGVLGDRAWGVVDAQTGKVASAKQPRIWAEMLGLRASYDGAPDGPVTITLPDGTTVTSDDADVESRLSAVLGRAVILAGTVPPAAIYEEEWPAIEGLAPPEFIAATKAGTSPGGLDVSALPVGMMAPGTFQDVAPITVMTTASLRAARVLHPGGDWDARRFRSTILIDTEGDTLVEQDWVGRTLHAGDVALAVTAPTPRCVMVTLAQQDLPPDADVLRVLAKHNRVDVAGTGLYACLGVYASVVTPGTLRRGDAVTVN